MTEQEIYDTVCAHLAKQGMRSIEHGRCQYRDRAGRKCAIGCLIPDDLYDPRMDSVAGNYASRLLSEFPRIGELFAGIRPNFLDCLQQAHDTQFNPSHLILQQRLAQLASHFGLRPGAEEAITEWRL